MKRYAMVLVALLLFASILTAQTSNSKQSASTSTLSGGINLRSIAGVPFSADVVRQSTQLQPDGSRALVETHGKMFRDSQGRTRTETELASGAGSVTRHFTTIFDPVQRTSIVLNVEAKTATVFYLHLPPASAPSAKQLKLVAAAQAAQARKNSLARSTSDGPEDLGTMTLEGFSVIGTRSAHPLKAGTAADKAQTAFTESWFSPELNIELLSITQLPQALTETTRLINIAPGEPDSNLFQAPVDYTVQDHSQSK
ncbi:MAG TPA: hypothetical protein VFR24_09005 [Candidatus Angelobacter sp.]|nr:hypothetical protein [Candidatus Angelobacter sp.]